MKILIRSFVIVGTVFGCSLSLRAESVESCNIRLNELRAADATIVEQLEKILPTIPQGSKKVSNRLYEQLMLERVQTLAMLSMTEQRCSDLAKAGNLPTEEGDGNARLTALERRVDVLSKTVQSLAVENAKLARLVAEK